MSGRFPVARIEVPTASTYTSTRVDADELRDKILKSVPQDVPDGNAGNVHPIKTDVPEVRLDRPATAIEGH